MASFDLGLSAASVLWTAALIGAYALLVNGFYQIVSKRVMFASKLEQTTEKELKEAMAATEAAREETEQAVTAAAAEDSPALDQTQIAAASAVDAEQAIAKAEAAIEKQSRSAGQGMARNVAYFALVPVVIFGFFLLLSGALILLTGGQREVAEIFGISLAVILAVRIVAYISEPTSHDVAKMLPLSLLGFFLVDGGFSNTTVGLQDVIGLRGDLARVLGFLAVIVIVEFTLRLVYFVVRRIRQAKWLEKQEEELRH